MGPIGGGAAVRNDLNQLVRDLPVAGILVEVTAPFANA